MTAPHSGTTHPPRTLLRPIGALRHWQAEVWAGVAGQDPDDPETWREDALFIAARYEAEAEESAALATTMRQTRPTTWPDGSRRSERASWSACAVLADRHAAECRLLAARALADALAAAREVSRVA